LALSRDSRTEKKLKAFRRAEFRLKQRFDYIDWEEDFLYKEIEAFKSGAPILGLDAGAVFDMQVGDAHKALGEVKQSSGAAAGDCGEPHTGDHPTPPDAGAEL
jgi:hypothetical protein